MEDRRRREKMAALMLQRAEMRSRKKDGKNRTERKEGGIKRGI